MEGRISNPQIETGEVMRNRVVDGLKEFGPGHHALFCHAGVMEVLLNDMGFFGIEIDNCGMMAVRVNSSGSPVHTMGYWSPEYVDH